MDQLIASDSGSSHRQLHVHDARGGIATHTGSECIEWCGHAVHDRFSLAGNMLAGPEVLDETARVYRELASLPFAPRLLAAMVAGQTAGGDKRGRQSAALLVHTGEEYPTLDLRVDDHPDPLVELARLEQVSREAFVPFMRLLTSGPDTSRVSKPPEGR